MAGYTRQRLIAAKACVLGIASFATGWYLGREEGDYAASILVTTAIFGTMAGVYELVSAWVATWLGGARASDAWGGPLPGPLAAAATPAPQPDAAVMPQPLRLRDALMVLAVFLAAQLVVWVVAALVAVLSDHDARTNADMTAAVLRVFPVALPLSMIVSALAVFLLTRRFSRREGAGPARRAFALQPADRRSQLLAAGAGALVAALLSILSVIAPAPDVNDRGLLAQALSGGPLGRIAFGLTAVLLAPPVEEYVFRGVLLGTLLPNIGPIAGGALSGTVFWMLHVAEWSHYWPAALGIGAMTALVTVLRLRTGSIMPGIGAHMVYNATLAFMALLV